MNIGVVVDNELNDDKRVLREIKVLREAGYNISVLCFSFDNKEYSKHDGLAVYRINISKKWKDILFFFMNSLPVYEWMWAEKISEFISKAGVEVLHIHDLYMSKAGWSGIKKSGKKIPLILDLHENYPYAVTTYNWTKGLLRQMISRPHQWKLKERKYLGYPARIVVLSEEFRDQLVREYQFPDNDHFCIFPNVPDKSELERFRNYNEETDLLKSAPVLLYYGVVAERRGIFTALDSFAEIIEGGFNAEFLIIGPIDKKDSLKFHKIISSPGIRKHVRYIPWIDNSRLPSYLHLSDICLAPFLKNPQHESGIANKIYDYMAGARPVIASDCLPQQNLIEKYECGLIFRNPDELTDSIIALLSDEDLRTRMGENGRNALFRDLNLDIKKSDLLNAYSSLLNN